MYVADYYCIDKYIFSFPLFYAPGSGVRAKCYDMKVDERRHIQYSRDRYSRIHKPHDIHIVNTALATLIDYIAPTTNQMTRKSNLVLVVQNLDYSGANTGHSLTY